LTIFFEIDNYIKPSYLQIFMTTKPILSALQCRYATKKFDPTKKVSEADLQELLEALHLSASSYGLQPWKFVVVTDTKLRNELRQHAWNQPQVTDASHLLVLCARTDLNEEYVTKYVQFIAETRGIPVDSLKGYQDMMLGFVAHKDKAALVAWAKLQVYLALGTLLSAAAQKSIDSCPMEGFDATAFDEILGLEKKGLTTAVLCPVGYRAVDDSSAAAKKVRFAMKDVVVKV
jgi:nitroreductase